MFKKVVIIFTLFALLVQMLGRVLVVAHFEEYRVEIAERYCHHTTKIIEADCFGTCYLTNELDKHEQDQEKNPVKSLEKDDFTQDGFSFLTILKPNLPSSINDRQKALFTYRAARSRLACLSVFRPPTV